LVVEVRHHRSIGFISVRFIDFLEGTEWTTLTSKRART
jgi:hypothetical protein